MAKSSLPLAPLERIIREARPNIKVSKAAVEELAAILTRVAEELSESAAINAQHAKRKTIFDDDFKLAARNLLRK